MSKPSMSVAAFVLEATQCSGRIQRIVSDDDAVDTSFIMEQLATCEVYAVTAERAFDIQRLGVEKDGTLRVEVSERWTLSRVVMCIEVVLIGVIILGVGITLGSAL